MQGKVGPREQSGCEADTCEAGAVNGADQGQHDLSAVSVTTQHQLVAMAAGRSLSVRRVTEQNLKVCCQVTGIGRWAAHPWSLASGDEDGDSVKLCQQTIADRTLPPGILKSVTDELVVISPVMVSENEPAGGSLCEWSEDFDGFLQKCGVVDQVPCEEDGIGGVLLSEADEFAVVGHTGSAGEMQVREMQEAERSQGRFLRSC